MGTWNKDRAEKRIKSKIDGLAVNDIAIKDYVRDTDLTNLPNNVAYRVNGVHLYADILNLEHMLQVTSYEGEMCHKRTLRFLNLHYGLSDSAADGLDPGRLSQSAASLGDCQTLRRRGWAGS